MVLGCRGSVGREIFAPRSSRTAVRLLPLRGCGRVIGWRAGITPGPWTLPGGDLWGAGFSLLREKSNGLKIIRMEKHGKSRKVRKSGKRRVTQAQLLVLAGWDRFLEVHAGAYPATLAAIQLRMSSQGVYQASERGWIAFYRVGRDRWYSRRDVIAYRHQRARNYLDNRPLPSPVPLDETAS